MIACMNCKRHGEILSLRAEVKRFENGVEYQKLTKELQKKNAEIERCNVIIARYIVLISQMKEKLTDREEQIRILTVTNECKDDLLSSVDLHTVIDLKTAVHQLQVQNTQLTEQVQQKDGMILKLQAQLNRDCTNSSKPSSQDPNHKIIHNNRPKTSRRPGG